MENYKVKAQVALEFTTAFICLILFLVATTQIFVWFGNNIVQRHKQYENTRPTLAADGTTAPPKINFYTPKNLNIFGKPEELPK